MRGSKAMHAHIRRDAQAQSNERIPIAKRFACAFFAASLAFSLMPTGAFQPTRAYADEAGTHAVAEGTMAEEASAPGDAVAEDDAQDAAAAKPDAEGDTVAEAEPEDAMDAEDDAAAAAGAHITAAAVEAEPEDAVDTEASAPAATGAEIAVQNDVGVELHVEGIIRFYGMEAPDPDNPGAYKYDSTFDRGMNKVCIDRSAFGGKAYALMQFEPRWEDGQDAAREAWERIPAREKYMPESVRVESEDETIVRALFNGFVFEGDESQDMPVSLVFETMNPGTTTVRVMYEFRDPQTSAAYHAYLSFPVHVQETANVPTGIAVPSTTVTTWLDATFNPPSGTGRSVYYYQYDKAGDVPNGTQQFIVSVSTGSNNPATYRFDDMFDISIADPSVITDVYNTHWESSDTGAVNGPDAHSYGLNFVAAKAGSTNITITLKQDPTKSVTFAVTVRTDHPEVSVSDFAMTMDEPQRIYVEDDVSTWDDASPITVPVRARQLSWYASQAKPFVTSITSSNEGVLSVQRITSPSYWVSLAPFELVPVSVGTANLTLMDCYGKTYTCAVTVNPTGDVDPGVKVNSVTLVRAEDGQSVSKSTVTMNISDTEGVRLAADIDADGNVTTSWTSSNPAIAEVVTEVDEDGNEICIVKPVRTSYDDQTKTTADCRITATVNGSVSDYCNIEVEPLEGLCGADPSSPLGAATIAVSKAMPADVLEELKSVALSISSIAAGDQAKVDDASSALEKGGAKLGGVFDIHFVNKADNSEHAWNKPSCPITVKVPMTDSMRELSKIGTLAFYHVDPATGERTKMPTWVDADEEFVCFETTHFSPFILVAEPEEQAEEPKDDNGETTKPDDADKGDSDNTDKVDSDKGDSDKADMTGNENSGDNETASDEEASASMPPKTGAGGYTLVLLALVAAAASLALFVLSRLRDRKTSDRAQGHWQKQGGAAGVGCRLQGFLPCQKRLVLHPGIPKSSLRSFYLRA